MERELIQKVKQLEDIINNSNVDSNEIFEISKNIDELVIETLNKKLK